MGPAPFPASATKGKQSPGAKSTKRATPACLDFGDMENPNQEVPSGVLAMNGAAAAAGAELATVLVQELWWSPAPALLPIGMQKVHQRVISNTSAAATVVSNR